MKNSINLLSNDFITSLLKQNNTSYSEFMSDIREDLNQGFDTPVVSIGFMEKLNEFMKDDSLKSYNSYTHYWSQLIEKMVYLIQLHEEIEFEATGELIAELTQFWEDSEYSTSFDELSQEGSSLIDSSDSLKTLLENQILSFFHLHLASRKYKIDDVLLYSSAAELGDSEERLCFGLKNKSVLLGETSDIYPLVGIKEVDPKNDSIELEINTDVYEAPLEAFPGKSPIGSFEVLNSSDSFTNRVADAMKNIQNTNQEIFNICDTFISALVESDTSLVSFNLPGHCLVDSKLTDVKELELVLINLAADCYFNAITFDNEVFSNEDENEQLKFKSAFSDFFMNKYEGKTSEVQKVKGLTSYGKKVLQALA